MTRSGVRSKVRQVLSRVLARKYVKSEYGVVLRANWADTTFKLGVNGGYGPFYATYLSHVESSFTFIDIGANQGLYSLLAAKNPHCQKVFSFEPVPYTFSLLQQNVEANGVRDKVSLQCWGLSDGDRQATIAFSPVHTGAASVHHGDPRSGTLIQLRGIAALAQLVEDSLPLVIKVDVEGHEQVILQAIRESSFCDRIMSIFYEVDEDWSDTDGLRSITEAIGLTRSQKIGSGTHYDVLATRDTWLA